MQECQKGLNQAARLKKRVRAGPEVRQPCIPRRCCVASSVVAWFRSVQHGLSLCLSWQRGNRPSALRCRCWRAAPCVQEAQVAEEKECRLCKETKAAADFFRSKDNADGLFSYCRP